MAVIILSIIVYILNCIKNKDDIAKYELFCTEIFMLTFIFVQSFDVVFILYEVFFTFPFLRLFRYIKLRLFLVIIFFLFELIVGLFVGNIYTTIAVACTRYLPLLLIAYICGRDDLGNQISHAKAQSYIRLTACFEIINIGLLVIFNSGSTFMIVNHQPIGGMMSIITSLMILKQASTSDTQNEKRKFRVENTVISVLCIIASVLSLTRGYMILVIPCTLFALFIYYISRRARLPFIILMIVICGSLCLIFREQVVILYNRMDTDIGYRTLENRLVLTSIKQSNMFNVAFGYGVGATGTTYASDSLISTLAGNSHFYQSHLSNLTGLQNFWLTCLKDLGIIGLCLFAVLYLSLARYSILRKTTNKLSLYFFLSLYAFILFYRVTVTNGLLELFMCTVVAIENDVNN